MTLPSNIASVPIDPTKTFCEGGGLPVAGGNAIMPKINKIRDMVEKAYLVQDWHPPGHSSFASTHGREPFTLVWLKEGQVVGDYVEGEVGPEGAGVQMLWTDHAIQGTEDADFHPDLIIRPEDKRILQKGVNPLVDSYSCVFENDKVTRPTFPDGKTLPQVLREDGIDTVIVSGIALDVCVRDSAIDLKKEGFRVVVVVDATADITPEGKAATLEKFKELGIETTTVAELANYFKSAPSVQPPSEPPPSLCP